MKNLVAVPIICLLLLAATLAGAAEPKRFVALYEIEVRDKTGFIDASGKVVIPPQLDAVRGGFKEGFTRVKKGDLWGFMDTTGRIMALKYEGADDFEEGRARVKGKKLWGYIDRSGAEVIPMAYDDAADFHEGLAKVKKNDKWGYINQRGQEVVPPQYKDADDFKEGLARVKSNKLWGYINAQGKLVIEQKFLSADDFKGGLAKVKTENDRPAYINKKGTVVWEQPKE
jgi:WG containing repeat